MPVGMEFPMYNGLANLPPFNPDLDDDNAQLHEAVRGWRKQLRLAEAIVICVHRNMPEVRLRTRV